MPDLFGHTEEPEVIVAIRPTQRDANRATIRVGRKGDSATPGRKKPRVVATLTVRRIADLDLHVGQPWTDDLAKQVEANVGIDKAMRSAMSRLSQRAMTGHMLREKLRKQGHEHVVIDEVLERLAELDLLDDEQFGRSLIRDTMSRKPAGPALLKQKLYQKGIRGALADRLVAEATSDRDEQSDAAIAFALKKAGSMTNLDRTTRDRRLYGQLARRGFGPDTIRAAMEAVRRGGDE
jgi:regulatory protein